MARKRKANSTYPFGGLGLDSAEEDKLIKLLKKKEISLQRLKRYLIREWISQQSNPNSGVLKLNKL